jgi:phage shock protein C
MVVEAGSPERLYRSRDNRVVAGVLGGVGEYLNVDPVAVRAVYVVLAALSGFFPPLVAYLILFFIIPEKPETKKDAV